MKIYKKCPCCGKIMFLLLGSDFGNEIEFGSAFGKQDNMPHKDTNHEEDWECLSRFLTCLNNSHGEIFISLKEQEKGKIPKEYKENILSWTEGEFKKEEPKEPPKNKKTIKEWWEAGNINKKQYELLIEDNNDPEYLFTLSELSEIIQRIKKDLAERERKEQERREREQQRERQQREPSPQRKEEIRDDGRDWSKLDEENFHPQLEKARKERDGLTLKEQWLKSGFNYGNVEGWLATGVKYYEIDLAVWLRDKKQITPSSIRNIEGLRREYEAEQPTHNFD